MTESPLPIDPLRQAGIDPTGKVGSNSKSNATDAASSLAFRAILDRLADKAADLGEARKTMSAPEDLASAVGDAKQSLEEAVSLGDRLLEAVRAQQLNENQSTQEGEAA